VPAVGTQNGYFIVSPALQAVNLTTQATAWTFAGDGFLSMVPIVVNDYVFIGSSQGNLYALDPASGATVWNVNFGTGLLAGAYDAGTFVMGLSAGDGLLLVPAGNTLTAFRLSNSP
jgi:outer membrane protein assembly factor BamB